MSVPVRPSQGCGPTGRSAGIEIGDHAAHFGRKIVAADSQQVAAPM